jgi:hypothetical protein
VEYGLLVRPRGRLHLGCLELRILGSRTVPPVHRFNSKPRALSQGRRFDPRPAGLRKKCLQMNGFYGALEAPSLEGGVRVSRQTGKAPSILAAWIFRSARSQCP